MEELSRTEQPGHRLDPDGHSGPEHAGSLPAQRRARLKDVAALAGVSESTASKVVNEVSVVSVRPETRARILAAVDQLQYRPHAAARVLAGAPSRVLALLVPDLANPSYVALIRGAYEQARQHDYTVLLAEDFDAREADESLVDLVRTGRADGLVIASARPSHRLVSWLDTSWVPHVFVNRAVPNASCNVVMQVGRASAAAVEHLAGLGHRSIGHVAGPAGIETAQARASAFQAALRRRHLGGGPIVRTAFTEEGGAAGAAALLEGHPELTAIFTSSFGQAVGALHACRTRSLRVPDDVSVIASDEMPLGKFLHPPLTTVAMPLFELGAAAVDALVDQLAGNPPHDVVVRRPARLIARASTGPPRPEATPAVPVGSELASPATVP